MKVKPRKNYEDLRTVEKTDRNKPKEVSKARIVHQYSVEGKFIKSYSSASHAAAELGIGSPAISNAAGHKGKTACGFYWQYEQHENIDVSQFELKRQSQINPKRPVRKLTIDGKPLETYGSIYAAAKATKIPANMIRSNCAGRTLTWKGFIWRHTEA